MSAIFQGRPGRQGPQGAPGEKGSRVSAHASKGDLHKNKKSYCWFSGVGLSCSLAGSWKKSSGLSKESDPGSVAFALSQAPAHNRRSQRLIHCKFVPNICDASTTVGLFYLYVSLGRRRAPRRTWSRGKTRTCGEYKLWSSIFQSSVFLLTGIRSPCVELISPIYTFTPTG